VRDKITNKRHQEEGREVLGRCWEFPQQSHSCLRTVDQLRSLALARASLLSNSSSRPKMQLIDKSGDGEYIWHLKQLLNGKECDKLLKQLEVIESYNSEQIRNMKNQAIEPEFQDMQPKYDDNIRKGKRLVFLDYEFAQVIWSRLLKSVIPALQTQFSSLIFCPRGFSVQPVGKWELSGVNECIRALSYRAGEGFTVHRDAQYCPSSKERSVFSLILYLNDPSDYSGGSTCFYLNTDSNPSDTARDWTVNEELTALRNSRSLKEVSVTDDCLEAGDAVMFSQSLLHSGQEVVDGKKWVLKFDIVASQKVEPICSVCWSGINEKGEETGEKRKSGEREEFCVCGGFVVHQLEKKDYDLTLTYFRTAQQLEIGLASVHGANRKKLVNELYERTLSIRYSYPRVLLAKLNASQDSDKMEITSEADMTEYLVSLPYFIWETIFDYAGPLAAEYIAYIFPYQLGVVRAEWEQRRRRKGNELMELIQTGGLFITARSKSYFSSPVRVRKTSLSDSGKQKESEISSGGDRVDCDEALFIPHLNYHVGPVTRLSFRSRNFFEENTEGCLRVAAVYAFSALGINTDDPMEGLRRYTVRYNPETGSVCSVSLFSLLSAAFDQKPCYDNCCYYMVKQGGDKEQPALDFKHSVDRNYMLVKHHKENVGVDLNTANKWHRKKFGLETYGASPSWDGEPFDEPYEACISFSLRAASAEKNEYVEDYDYGLSSPDDYSIERTFQNELPFSPPPILQQHLKPQNKADKPVVGAAIFNSVSRDSPGEFHYCPIGGQDHINTTSDLSIFNHLVFDFSEAEMEVKELTEEEFEKKRYAHLPCSKLSSKHYYSVSLLPLLNDPQVGFNHASCNCYVPDLPFESFNLAQYPLLNHVLVLVEDEPHPSPFVSVYVLYGGITAF